MKANNLSRLLKSRTPKTAPVEEDPKMLIWDFCILTS